MRIERGEIDPSFIITHRIGLEDACLIAAGQRAEHYEIATSLATFMRPAASPARQDLT